MIVFSVGVDDDFVTILACNHDVSCCLHCASDVEQVVFETRSQSSVDVDDSALNVSFSDKDSESGAYSDNSSDGSRSLELFNATSGEPIDLDEVTNFYRPDLPTAWSFPVDEAEEQVVRTDRFVENTSGLDNQMFDINPDVVHSRQTLQWHTNEEPDLSFLSHLEAEMQPVLEHTMKDMKTPSDNTRIRAWIDERLRPPTTAAFPIDRPLRHPAALDDDEGGFLFEESGPSAAFELSP
jgi:hypothetical protein